MSDYLNNNKIIKEIIDNNNKLLTIKDFLKNINYKYNENYMDIFGKYIENNNKFIKLTDEIIWLLDAKKLPGYSDESHINESKMDIIVELLELNIINKDYIIDINSIIYDNTDQYYNDIKNMKNTNIKINVNICIHIDIFKKDILYYKYYYNYNKKEHYNEFIIIENAYKIYTLYNIEFYKNKTNMVSNLLNDNSIFDNILIINNINVNQYVYIISTKIYEGQNIYKIGRTNNLKSRLSTYNTGKHKNDKYYYCYTFGCDNSIQLESIIKNKLKNFSESNSGEMIKININELLPIFKKICNDYTILYNYNKLIKQTIDL